MASSRRSRHKPGEPTAPDMPIVPMLDMSFQLMSFFILTFHPMPSEAQIALALPKIESMPADPLSPYAISKLAGERYCLAFAELYNLPVIALRYFNVYGPHQDPSSEYSAVIPKFITKLLAGERPTIYGDGSQSRDFTYVADVAAANLLAGGAPHHVSGFYNVARGDRISLIELAAQLNRILGTDLQPIHAAPRAGDVQHSQANITKISAALGFTPTVSFEQGLEQTVAFFREMVVRESVQGLTSRERAVAK